MNEPTTDPRHVRRTDGADRQRGTGAERTAKRAEQEQSESQSRARAEPELQLAFGLPDRVASRRWQKSEA